jgi:hypothetical protein
VKQRFGAPWFPFRIQLSSDSHDDNSRVWRNGWRDIQCAKREPSKIDILRFYEKIGTVRLRIGMNDFFAELKRRNVYKVALAYIVAGWALSQGIAQVLPVFDVPNWIIRFVVLLIIIGLPIALALAWTFELTPHGIKRTADVDLAGERSRSRAWVYIVVYLSEFCPRQARPRNSKKSWD